MKSKSHYVCQSCGSAYAKWHGRCANCEAWNTLVQEQISSHKKSAATSNVTVTSLEEALDAHTHAPLVRIQTQVSELDRALGGGIVPGSVILLGGEPGIGKSTLLLQALSHVQGATLYLSAEESLEQIAMRAERLGLKPHGLQLAALNDLNEAIAQLVQHRPQVVVIDSLQTFYEPSLESAPGSVGQVREVAHRLSLIAKSQQMAVFLVGQITKEGAIAGPKVVEHLVDVVLYFDADCGEDLRLLHVHKNRFGAVSDIGIFEMSEAGLLPVLNPSARFLSERRGMEAGAIASVALTGTRPLIVEVQALCVQTPFGMPRRTAIGMDHNRLAMLLAVLERRAGFSVNNHDVFTNIVGGLRLSDPACDLSTVLAVVSILKDQAIAPDVVAIGELGLSGEIRKVSRLEQRVEEALRMGFRRILVPKINHGRFAAERGKAVIEVDHIKQAIAQALEVKKS